MLILSVERTVYMDENFVEAYSQEDHYFVEGITGKIQNLNYFLHIQSKTNEALVL